MTPKKRVRAAARNIAQDDERVDKTRSSGNCDQAAAPPRNLNQVRESIDHLVRRSAEAIVMELIEVAKSGEAGPAKYLFEMIGLYPPLEGAKQGIAEDSLAQTLLRRLGLPTEPAGAEEPERTE